MKHKLLNNCLKFSFFVICNLGSSLASNDSNKDENENINLTRKALSNLNKEEKEPFFAISLDGGGVRGVLPATFLSCLEDELEKRLDSRINLAECVDVMAGTSTGGLIAIGLNLPNKDKTSPNYDARSIAEFYEKEGLNIFPTGGYFYRKYQLSKSAFTPRYARGIFEQIVDEKFFPHKVPSFKESFSSLMIPAYNATIGKLEYFTDDSRETLRDAAFATSAAPYYFAGYKTSKGEVFLDGGLIANNPAFGIFKNRKTLEALKKNRPVYLLSISTGHKQSSHNYSHLEEAGGLKLLSNFREFLSLIMQGTSQNTRETLGALHNHFSGKVNFINIDPAIPDDDMDNAQPGNIAALAKSARHAFDEALPSSNNNNVPLEDFIKGIENFAQQGKLLEKRLERHKSQGVDDRLDLSRIPFPALVNYDTFSNVKKLSLANTLRGAKKASELLKSINGKFSQLEVFDFSQNDLGKELSKNNFFDLVTSFKTLKVLILHTNSFNDSHMQSIKAVLGNGMNIKSLDLSHNQTSHEGLGEIFGALHGSPLLLLNMVNKGADSISYLSVKNMVDNQSAVFLKSPTQQEFKDAFKEADKPVVLY